jgi:spectinomycin phosphotransferase
VQVNRESFRPAWAEMVRRLDAVVQSGVYAEPQQRALAGFWQQKRAEILRILERSEELGRLMQKDQPPYRLCHADIHTANVLLDARGELYIIDWDGVILAPKERDLMFMVERKLAEGDAIFQGYGAAAIHSLALAYYRYEWVVQEIGDFGERVFFAEGTSDLTKNDSLRGFRALFDPQDVVESAYQSEIE